MDRMSLRKLGVVAALAVLMLALTAGAAFATAVGFSTPLMIDKGTQVGFVSVSHVLPDGVPPGNLVVTYAVFDKWHLQHVEVAVGNTLQDIPVNKSGNPIPGAFAWQAKTNLATFYQVVIPISESGLSGGDLVYFAAHAKVTNGWTTKDAWGWGSPFPGARNGATYFTVSCTNPG